MSEDRTAPRPWTHEKFCDGTHDVAWGPPDDPSERFSVIDDLNEANAALIVRAVNNHDALLAALKDASHELLMNGFHVMADRFDAVIAKAEGKAP